MCIAVPLKVRLYLNNRLLGEKEVNLDTYTASFEVPYEPGQLKAVNPKERKKRHRLNFAQPGIPAMIRLTADHTKNKGR